MSSGDLSSEVLSKLLALYLRLGRAVKFRELQEYCRLSKSQLAKLLQELKSEGLVESKTGPSGGFKPTPKAYFRTSKDIMVGSLISPHAEEVTHALITEIRVDNLLSREGARAFMKYVNDIGQVTLGSKIQVIPNAGNFVLSGKVYSLDTRRSMVVLKVLSLIAVSNLTVRDVTREDVPCLEMGDSILQALHLMGKFHVSGLAVCRNDRRVAGVVLAVSLFRLKGLSAELGEVSQVLTTGVPSLDISSSITEAILKFVRHETPVLPVVNTSGEYVGLVEGLDLLKVMLAP